MSNNYTEKKIIGLTKEQDSILKSTANQMCITASEVIRNAIESYCTNEIEYVDFNSTDTAYEDFCKTLKITSSRQSCCTIEKNILAVSFYKIEVQDLRVAEIYVNPKDFCDLRTKKDILEVETRRTYLMKCIMGYMWGAQIIVNKKVPVGTILFLSEAKYRTGYELQIVRQDIDNNRLMSLLDFVKDIHSKIDQEIKSITKTQL